MATGGGVDPHAAQHRTHGFQDRSARRSSSPAIWSTLTDLNCRNAGCNHGPNQTRTRVHMVVGNGGIAPARPRRVQFYRLECLL